MSAQAANGIMNVFRMDDNLHWIYRGTSAAAAHTAGAAALLLQQSPHMSPSALRKTLLARAKHDSYTGLTPNGTVGAGKLDLLPAKTAGVAEMPGGIDLSSPYPNPSRGSMTFRFAVESQDLHGSDAVRLRVIDLSGREVSVVHGAAVPGEQQLVWNGLTSSGRPAAPGVYLGRLEVGTRWAVRKLVRME
jgi:subtilisin family serine protease